MHAWTFSTKPGINKNLEFHSTQQLTSIAICPIPNYRQAFCNWLPTDWKVWGQCVCWEKKYAYKDGTYYAGGLNACTSDKWDDYTKWSSINWTSRKYVVKYFSHKREARGATRHLISQPLNNLFKRLFVPITKKSPKLCITGICVGVMSWCRAFCWNQNIIEMIYIIQTALDMNIKMTIQTFHDLWLVHTSNSQYIFQWVSARRM